MSCKNHIASVRADLFRTSEARTVDAFMIHFSSAKHLCVCLFVCLYVIKVGAKILINRRLLEVSFCLKKVQFLVGSF